MNNCYKNDSFQIRFVPYIDKLIYMVAFLFSLQFLSKSSLYIIILIDLFLLKFLITKKKIIIPKILWFIVAFCVIYNIICIINFSFNISITFLWVVGVPAISIISYNYIWDYQRKINLKLLLCLILGMFCHGLLNLVISNPDLGRNPTNIWTGTIIAATLQNSFFTAATSLLLPVCLFSKNIYHKIIVCIIFAISLLNAVFTSTRTGLLLPILVTVVVFILILFHERKNKKWILKILSFLFYFLIFNLLVLLLNIFKIRDKIFYVLLNIFNNKRSLFSDPRFGVWEKVLKNLWVYPLGGQEFRDSCGEGFAHNLWLDIIQRAGVFIGIIYLVYTITAFYNLIKLYKNKNIDNLKKFILIAVSLAIYLNCAVEAILDGNFIMVIILFGIETQIRYIVKPTSILNKIDCNNFRRKIQ